MDLRRRNRRTAVAASAVIAGMLGLTALSVPLYNLFCAVTGYGGTPRIGGEPGAVAATDRTVTVFFNADTDPDLPWSFQPAQRSLEVKPGEQTLAFYEAVNRADHPVVGRAAYNVTPFKIGSYFSKIHCFCFDEQTLKPGERIDMPVSFYVDPAMLKDADTSEVGQITLSYTFYIDKEATARLRAQGQAAGGSTS
jgi:cytochrome c oxidase assembly protein subunit 11